MNSKDLLNSCYGMRTSCVCGKCPVYRDTDSFKINDPEIRQSLGAKRYHGDSSGYVISIASPDKRDIVFSLFKSCMDQYRDYVTLCDDPDRDETALALQRARVAAIYSVIESCGLEVEYAAFKEIMHE